MPTTDELIRKALQDRAATVTPSTLRYAEPRQDLLTGRRQPGAGDRPRVLVAAAAAVVGVVAIAVGAFVIHSRGGHANPAGGTANALVGTQWRLTEVRSGDNTAPVPTTYTAELGFGVDGGLNGRDGLNAFAGSYRTSGNRITLRVVAVGGAGSTATIPAQEAMLSIYAPTAQHADSVTSTFDLTASTLTVVSSRWTLIFGPVATSSPSPSTRLNAPGSYCLHSPPLRTGTETSLVPGTPTALTICPNGPTRPAKTVANISDLVHVLDALPTAPAANGCQARGSSARPAVGTYELHFHYQSGPDVLVNVLPQCRPSINNLRLQADSSTTVIPLIQAALQQS